MRILLVVLHAAAAAAAVARLHHFQGDIIAGITVGLTVVPQSLAYANIAELPPQVSTRSPSVIVFRFSFFFIHSFHHLYSVN